jgi:hypothetical protein
MQFRVPRRGSDIGLRLRQGRFARRPRGGPPECSNHAGSRRECSASRGCHSYCRSGREPTAARDSHCSSNTVVWSAGGWDACLRNGSGSAGMSEDCPSRTHPTRGSSTGTRSTPSSPRCTPRLARRGGART